MKNLPIIALIILVAVLYLFLTIREKFSTSGLAISDDYCNKLADVYHMPMLQDQEARDDYKQRICGRSRRYTVDSQTGNYYTENGTLI
jgi:hypothetical protein